MSGSPARVLRHRGFAAFFSAAAISNAAVWMQMIAVPALLFDLTGKATWLGISSIVTLVPQVILSPYAGVLADRVSRRRILLVTQFGAMFATFGLWALYVGDDLTPMRIIGINFVAGLFGAFQNSTWQAFIPLLVPRADMLDAVRLNTVQFTIARAIGPAFAGLVLAQWGSGVAIFVNASTFLLVIGVLLALKPRETATMAPDTRVLHAVRDGAVFMWRNLPFRVAVIVAFASAAFGQSMQQQASAVSRRIFDHPSKDSAWLLTALGCGAFVTFIGWTVVGERLRRSRQILLSQTGFIVSALTIAATTKFWVGVVGYAIGGFSHLTTAVGVNTLLQGEVPDEMRGRMMSFYLMGIIGGIPLGTFTIGRIGDEYGMRWALAVDAGILITIVLALLLSGWLRALDVTTMAGDRFSDEARTAGSAPAAR